MSTDKKTPKEYGDGPKIAVLVFIALLVAGGIWVFNSLQSSNDMLNCVASGRTNCAPVSR
jgi:hypothetical protein